MLFVALGQLRRRWGRTLALVLALVLATGSFVLLTGSAETSQLRVRGTVAANFRSTYDLLVRPASSYTPLETEKGLVRPNFQSGIFGGITLRQVETIRKTVGVEVAAPTGNIGYVNLTSNADIELTPYLNGDAQQLFRVIPTWSMDRGLTKITGAPVYVYYSTNSVKVIQPAVNPRSSDPSAAVAEEVPGGGEVTVCRSVESDQSATTRQEDPSAHASPFPASDPYRTGFSCYYKSPPAQVTADIGLRMQAQNARGGVWVGVAMTIPVLLTAIDPVAEQAMSGLDQAVVAGRALTASDSAFDGQVVSGGTAQRVVPVMASSRAAVDVSMTAEIRRVSAPATGRITDAVSSDVGAVARIAKLQDTLLATSAPQTAADSYAKAIQGLTGAQQAVYFRVGQVGYSATEPLQVAPVVNSDASFVAPGIYSWEMPEGTNDSSVRTITIVSKKVDTTTGLLPPVLQAVGSFDPTLLGGNSSLSGLATSDYAVTPLTGADSTSTAALGGGSWLASSNVAGYPAQPPSLLTTFAGASELLSSSSYHGVDSNAPVSVVRVRVAGVTGTDAVSRERLNQTALAISEATGLAVDIVSGASGAPVTVVVPAGEHGRPELRLVEQWARKGVAYEVVQAIDRKSALLFGLILGVCTIVVANAASASVRTRRAELGVLACLGWGRAKLFGVVQLELAVVGLVSGVVGAGLALLVGRGLGISTSAQRALIAVPAAMALVALAGLVPALRASRSDPMSAVRPQVVAGRRVGSARSVVGLALQGLVRAPGRTVLGVAGLVIGVAAATFMLAVQSVFRGNVVGSMLGDAVAVQVRTPDLIALTAIALLGAAGVADVLFLAAREQAFDYAVLRATGWSSGQVAAMVVTQGLVLGLLSGAIGAALGAWGVSAFVGTWTAQLGPVAAMSGAAGVVVGVVAALAPAVLIGRTPMTTLLAEDE